MAPMTVRRRRREQRIRRRWSLGPPRRYIRGFAPPGVAWYMVITISVVRENSDLREVVFLQETSSKTYCGPCNVRGGDHNLADFLGAVTSAVAWRKGRSNCLLRARPPNFLKELQPVQSTVVFFRVQCNVLTCPDPTRHSCAPFLACFVTRANTPRSSQPGPAVAYDARIVALTTYPACVAPAVGARQRGFIDLPTTTEAVHPGQGAPRTNQRRGYRWRRAGKRGVRKRRCRQ